MFELGKKISLIILLLLLVGGGFFVGFYFGENSIPEIDKVTELDNKETGKTEIVDFSAFWKAWNVINEKFVPTEDASLADTNERVWGAISGLADSLKDPYTQFFPPEDAKIFTENINGEFGGVGMEIGRRDGLLIVISPLKGTPAERAGIRPGDIIFQIDGEPSAEIGVDKAVQLIRGEVGTSVDLTLLREDMSDPIEVTIIREQIQIPTIETELVQNVFVIRLFNFGAPSSALFRDALQEFSDGGTDKLIIDLRGNPGGFLEASIDMASWFLPSGKTIVTEDFGDKKEKIAHRSRGFNVFNENLKLVVLVNGGSASASEILAGALKDHGVALVIGTKTFGKGSVQELVPITEGSSLKITIARWLTPNGVSISAGGVAPDIEVEFSPEEAERGEDPQLDKAIETLNKDDFFELLKK